MYMFLRCVQNNTEKDLKKHSKNLYLKNRTLKLIV